MTNAYSKDHALNLFQRVDFQGIAYSDGEEIEQRILAAVSSASDRGTFSTELAAAITDWPSEYHLSRQRHCLIRPLDIRPGEKVLELGCGCGAITRFLGEIGADVTAVEGSATRARIAAERCRDLPNVKIIADDLLQFVADERFDWVLLIGVLEYAPVFSTEQQPVLHYLRNVVERMAPHGHLAVAIENKLGMKYFNGCGEDHLRVPFSGLQGLYGDRTPRTFGRGELKAELEAAGLSDVAFQYPFPDYKLPQVILTDEALSDPTFNPVDMLALIRARDYADLPYRLFDEALVLREAAHNGLLGELSNSFLVVASAQVLHDRSPSPDQTLAISYAVQRLPEFTTQTRFVRAGNTIHVYKEPLHSGLERRGRLADGSQLENIVGDANYVFGELAVWGVLEERARRGDLQQIVAALLPWFDYLFKMAKVIPRNAKFFSVERTLLSDLALPGYALDLTPFNLIDTGDSLVPIDQEWRIDRDIDMGWVVTRAVLYVLTGTIGFEISDIAVVDVIRALAQHRGLDVSEAEIVIWLNLERMLQATITEKQMPGISLRQQAARAVPLYLLTRELEESRKKLSGELAKERRDLGDAQDSLHNLTKMLRRKEEENEKERAEWIEKVAVRDRELAEKNIELDHAHEALRRAAEMQKQNDITINKLDEQISVQKLTIDVQRRDVASLKGSRSWRITAPLRALQRRLPYRAIKFFKWSDEFLWQHLINYYSRRTISRSPLFAKAWYLERYADVRDAKADPIDHYLRFGADEGRNPGPLFDTSYYLSRYSDVATSGVNPLVHYLRYGRREGRQIKGTDHSVGPGDSVDHLPSILELIGSGGEVAPATPIPDITIVVPVYNGLDHLKRLLPSLAKNTDSRHLVVIIDDASPDDGVWPYLEEWSRLRPNVKLVRSEKNQGFVRSVNTGAAMAAGHFVIINTDTEVPPGWLERIVQPIVADPNVASVTPFSNSATIFSFPDFAADNARLGDLDTEFIDAGFRTLAVPSASLCEAPTGVGFCMAINADVWRVIGGFDQDAFPKGYGEENDWCQRAYAGRFRNVLAPNLFVYHAHGGSFTASDKVANSHRGLAVVEKRWPNYLPAVAAFISNDPWRQIRLAAFINICCAARPIVIVDHAIGGGANAYRSKLEDEAIQSGRPVGLVTFDGVAKRYVLNFKIGTSSAQFVFREISNLNKLPAFKHGADIIYNNLVSWPDPAAMLSVLQDWARGRDVKLIVLFHDYFPICPSYNLLDRSGSYCGVPNNMAVCQKCLPNNRYASVNIEIRFWRRRWSALIERADEVVFFSQDSAAIAARAFSLSKHTIRVRPHQPLIQYHERRHQRPIRRTPVIGIVGSLNFAKGAGIVGELCGLLARTDPGIRVVVIGTVDPNENLSFPNLTIHGRYDRADLPNLLEKYEVSVCVLPSIWPETFSYVTQELMALGMPLVCFDIGAPAERVRDYKFGKVVRSMSASEMLANTKVLLSDLGGAENIDSCSPL